MSLIQLCFFNSLTDLIFKTLRLHRLSFSFSVLSSSDTKSHSGDEVQSPSSMLSHTSLTLKHRPSSSLSTPSFSSQLAGQQLLSFHHCVYHLILNAWSTSIFYFLFSSQHIFNFLIFMKNKILLIPSFLHNIFFIPSMSITCGHTYLRDKK